MPGFFQPRRIAMPAPRLALILAVSALVACNEGSTDEGTREREAIAVELSTVSAEPVRPTLILPALVEARTRVELPFRVPGYLAQIDVDEGDRVEAGQLLAELDKAEFERALRTAAGDLASAKARAENAERAFERQENLLAARTTSRERHDDARSAHDVARAELRVARVRVEEARDRLEKASLHAPFAGYVEKRHVETHERVTTQEPALVLLELDTVVVRASVADHVISRLSRGDPVKVRSALAPEQVFTGAIARVGVAADPGTRTVPFEVEVPNEALALRPEQVMELELDLGGEEDRVLVPLPAVLRDAAARPFCFVAEPDGEQLRASRRAIDLGGIHGERVAVLSGLREGERLVVRGQHFLRDGDAIRTVGD